MSSRVASNAVKALGVSPCPPADGYGSPRSPTVGDPWGRRALMTPRVAGSSSTGVRCYGVGPGRLSLATRETTPPVPLGAEPPACRRTGPSSNEYARISAAAPATTVVRAAVAVTGAAGAAARILCSNPALSVRRRRLIPPRPPAPASARAHGRPSTPHRWCSRCRQSRP